MSKTSKAAKLLKVKRANSGTKPRAKPKMNPRVYPLSPKSGMIPLSDLDSMKFFGRTQLYVPLWQNMSPRSLLESVRLGFIQRVMGMNPIPESDTGSKHGNWKMEIGKSRVGRRCERWSNSKVAFESKEVEEMRFEATKLMKTQDCQFAANPSDGRKAPWQATEDARQFPISIFQLISGFQC